MPETDPIENPLVSYVARGNSDDPSSVIIEVEILGDGGGKCLVQFSDFQMLGAVAEMLWEAAVELFEGQELGIEHLAEIKGRLVEMDRDTTIEDILTPEGNPGGIAKTRNDILYPWVQRNEEEL